MKKNFLVIDPGINTGWAHIQGREVVAYGVIRARGKGFLERHESLMKKFNAEVLYFYPDEKIFIEFPSFQNLVAQNTGSIIKLAFIIGRLFEMCKTMEMKAELIPVSAWRGNCPKEILWRRAEKFFGLPDGILKDHEGDAVGIGQYLIQKRLL